MSLHTFNPWREEIERLEEALTRQEQEADQLRRQIVEADRQGKLWEIEAEGLCVACECEQRVTGSIFCEWCNERNERHAEAGEKGGNNE